MVVRWEGGAPPDGPEWVNVLSEALGEESGFYWVRFYRQAEGWRFDLERQCAPGPDGRSSYRPADESAMLRAAASLVARGKRVDPSWTPSASSPPAVVGAAEGMSGNVSSGARPRSSSPRGPLASSELTARRPPGRRGLRLVLVSATAVLLAVLAWWLLRDHLSWPPGSSPTPAPPSVPSEIAPKAHEETEGIVPASPQSVQPSASPSPPDAGAVGRSEQDSTQQRVRPSGRGGDESRPSDPAPTRRPAPSPPASRQGESAPDVNEPGLTPPVVVSQSCPPYPPLALERRLSGTVSLIAVVDETGTVVEVSRVRASPPGLGFEEAATSCVLSRAYRPARRHDVPVRVRLPIRIEFQPPGG